MTKSNLVGATRLLTHTITRHFAKRSFQQGPSTHICVTLFCIIFFGVVALSGPAHAQSSSAQPRVDVAPEIATLYAEQCSTCHGAKRYGGYAPPLIADALRHKKDDDLFAAILHGLPSTQMPAFADKISDEQARALLSWFRTPVAEIVWNTQDIAASRIVFKDQKRTMPLFARRKDLTLVVERGTNRVAVLAGSALREMDRYPSGLIHGGIKFDHRYRSALTTTRDGTVVKYDLRRGTLAAQVKAGINTRNLAISPDGNFIAVANQTPQTLVILDANLKPLASFALAGQPSAVYLLPRENSFILTLRDQPLFYLLSYPSLKLEEVSVPEPFEDISFVPQSSQLVASARGGRALHLYDWKTRNVLVTLATEALPHLFSTCFFERDGEIFAAFNHIGVPKLSLVRMRDFTLIKSIPLRGAGYFVRTHEGTPYLWVDTNTESLQLIDKNTLELRPEPLTPAPGKIAMHTEFTAAGDRALVSIWDQEGAVVVYDSQTLQEIRRLPYAMPVGKYNVYNKTRLFE